MITVIFLLNFFSGEKSPSGSPREQCPQGNLRTVRGIVVVSCMFARYYWSSAHSHIDFELAIIVTKPLFVLGKDWLSLFKKFKVVLLNGGEFGFNRYDYFGPQQSSRDKDSHERSVPFLTFVSHKHVPVFKILNAMSLIIWIYRRKITLDEIRYNFDTVCKAFLTIPSDFPHCNEIEASSKNLFCITRPWSNWTHID